MADVIVADRLTDANKKTLLGAIGLSVSWALNEAGLIAFDYPVKDMLAAGVSPKTLLGKWLHYTHPTAGAWGGQVTNVLVTDGIVSVSGESWLSCLRGAIGDGYINNNSWSASLRRFVNDLNGGLTGISATSESVVAFGAILSEEVISVIEQSGADIYEQILPGVLSAIANFSPSVLPYRLQPYGYNVDPTTRLFSFKKDIGTDRSATVRLADAVTNTGGSWGDDLSDVINTVTIEAVITQDGGTAKRKIKCPKKSKKKKCYETYNLPDHDIPGIATGKNTTSIAKYGPRGILITTDLNYRTQSNLNAAAKSLADAYAINQQLVTVKIAGQPTEQGAPEIFSKFREGDVVAIDLANSGGTGKLVVRYRALDVTSGEMTVSGEAEIV